MRPIASRACAGVGALALLLSLGLELGSARAQNVEPPTGIVFRDLFISRDGLVIDPSVAPPDSIVFRTAFIGRGGDVVDSAVPPPRRIAFRPLFVSRDGGVAVEDVAPPTGIVFRGLFISRDGTVADPNVDPPQGIVFRDPFVGRGSAPTAAPGNVPARRLMSANVVPNPFNPSAQLSFRLTRPGPVTVSVLDVRGREVRQLYRGQLEADVHVMRWDGTDDKGRHVSSGVYLFRVVAGGETLTVKGALLK